MADQRNRPDCWASNGVKPDDEVPHPVSPVCATCPNSAWGSGASAIAPKAQACQQRRRTVIVPYQNDLTNEAEGGPMLLSIPPASLSNQRKYGQDLKELVLPDGTKDIPYFAVITRLSFEKTDLKGQPIKFPKVKFAYKCDDEGRPIFVNDADADVIEALREGEAVKAIFGSRMNIDGGEVEAPGGESESLIQKGPAPKAAAAVAPKQGIPPAPEVKPIPPKPIPEAPRATATISEAVNNPAERPPSARAVNTAPPPKPEIKAVPPAVDEDVDAEAIAPIPGEAAVFANLMSQSLE